MMTHDSLIVVHIIGLGVLLYSYAVWSGIWFDMYISFKAIHWIHVSVTLLLALILITLR